MVLHYKLDLYFQELTHWKRLWCWEGLGAGGEGDDRKWDGWMASPTQWTWVWVNSGSWWWTGRPGVLWFMGSQRVGHDRVTELNWTEWLMMLNSFQCVYRQAISISPLKKCLCKSFAYFLKSVFNWFIILCRFKYTVFWFDAFVYCNMITITVLDNTCIMSHNYYFIFCGKNN